MFSHEEIVRLYGPWRLRTSADAAVLLRNYSGCWWVAGGWAIDAFTKTTREHGDLDIGIPRDDLKDFVDFVSPQLDAWVAAGSLTPMVPGQGAAIPAGCGNLWLRPSGADPWEYDVILESVKDLTWVSKRDPRISRPLGDCLWTEDGVVYLRPEVQLLLKAKHTRPKDTADFERCLDHLDSPSLDWLARILRDQSPRHPWLATLQYRKVWTRAEVVYRWNQRKNRNDVLTQARGRKESCRDVVGTMSRHSARMSG